MLILFWGLAIIMSLAAISFVAIPLKARKLSPGAPATFAIVAVPLAAFGLYVLLGSSGVKSAETSPPHDDSNYAQASSSTAQSSASIGTVASLVDGLSARLQKEPDDAGGWLLLAQSYDHLGRHADAIDAYERAQALGKTDIEFESSLLAKTPAQQMTETVSGPALRGRVELSPEAAARIEPGDVVFIFAKESAEHRMPVAALRKPATDLPLSFVLTDKEAMAPDAHLDQFKSLVVTAKISTSGSASDNSRGLEAWSEPVSPLTGEDIVLIIAAASQAEVQSDE